MVKTLKRLVLHEHSREAGKALLLVGRYFRQDMSITKLKVMDAHYYDFGVYEESFCAVGTQGAFQLRHAKKYKLWEHTL